MNIFWLKIAIWITTLGSPTQIIKRNEARQIAEKAFQEKNYDRAITYYEYLERTQLVVDPDIILNLAHAAFAKKDTALARQQYSRLMRVPNPGISSTALNQLGVIDCLSGDSLAAENLFRDALERNPSNDQARYNFELMRRFRRDVPPPATPPGTPPPTGTPPPPKESADVAVSTRRDEFLKSLKQFNLTEEQAVRLLEASHNQEIQYIQQRPRKAENVVDTREKW